MTQERQVTLPLSKAEKLLEVLDELEHELKHRDELDNDAWQRAQQLEALRQDLELAIVRSPR